MSNISKKIFIADDDPGIVDAVTMMLDFYEYESAYYYDGAELLGLTGNFPDLILLDIWMSGTDGRDVCRKIKSRPDMRHIPVIMISASRDVASSALASGADDFLPKPFDMDELMGKIQVMLDNKQSKASYVA